MLIVVFKGTSSAGKHELLYYYNVFYFIGLL